MTLHIIVEEGGYGGELVWTFADWEYDKALAMYQSLVYRDRDKGLMLQDGADDVWLHQSSGEKTLRQKILRAMNLQWSD